MSEVETRKRVLDDCIAVVDSVDALEVLRVYQAWQEGLQLDASRYAPATR